MNLITHRVKNKREKRQKMADRERLKIANNLGAVGTACYCVYLLMAEITVKAWKCDVCGKPWLKTSEKMPEKCARASCRSRLWNGGAGRPAGRPVIERPNFDKRAVAARHEVEEDDGPQPLPPPKTKAKVKSAR